MFDWIQITSESLVSNFWQNSENQVWKGPSYGSALILVQVYSQQLYWNLPRHDKCFPESSPNSPPPLKKNKTKTKNKNKQTQTPLGGSAEPTAGKL